MKNRELSKYHLIGLCFVLLWITNPLFSQSLSFNHIGVNDGLSQVSVNSLAQDNLGRIWIGTRDGLNVYNGENIKTFRPVRGDSTSLLGYFIIDIVPEGHYLWVLSKDGISLLDTKTLKFKRFPKNDVRSLLKYKNKILVGTQNGLFTLNSKSKSFTKETNILAEQCEVKDIFTDRSGILWLGTNVGLFAYNHDKNQTRKILYENTTSIYTDSKKQIWVGTANNGAFLFNNRLRLLKHFAHNENNPSIVNNIIRDIEEDSKGNIWIATFLGLSIIDADDYTITNYTHDETIKNSISHNSIYSILKDTQGNMWLGTYFGGISYLNNDVDIYTEYPVTQNNSPIGLNFSVIGKMLEDHNKNLWIATEGGGLDYFNRKTNTFTHYHNKSGKQNTSGNNIKSIALANKETLLIGTHTGGLNILNINSGNIKKFPASQYKTIDEILPYKDFYLLGTKNGLIKFDAKHEEFTPFFTKKEDLEAVGKSILSLFEDSYGTLWIGTEKNGLLSYDQSTHKLKKHLSSPSNLKSISANTISCIYEDHKFRLWIGTHGGGLNYYDRSSGEFINYNMQQHGLSSDFIQGIKESRYGNLWISCSKGISRFDVENSKIYNYTQKNGLPLNEINKNALLLTTDGEVFVGGVDGLISFNEETVLKRSNKFNLILSSISINNKEVIPLDQTEVLPMDLPFMDQITLKPNQNAFTINFSSSNYITTNQNTYKYRLENFNTNWINAGYKTSATYTNLNPGKYILHVQGLSGVEETVIDEKQLIIVVKPPFYRSGYAILLYVVILFSILIWLNRNFKNRLKLINKIKLEQKEKEQIKQLNQSKLNFFTNISHEFRTPLTLITGTLESVLEDNKTRPENYRKLVTTHNSAVRLNNLITELLDFRKLESGNLKLKVSENNINDFVEEIYQSFVEYAQHQKVEYLYSPLNSSQTLWFDHSQMEKVFYNIISNAFKFVEEENGKIELRIVDLKDHVDVIISDNGLGIPADKAKQIFDLYYQIDNLEGKQHKHSSGIGLALCKSILKEHHGDISLESDKGRGTRFIVSLKKGNMHFNESDLVHILPYEEEKTDISPIIQEEQLSDEPLEGESNEKLPTVLVVEDNKEIQNLLKEILKSNYNILLANDGNEGFDTAIQQQPDLVLSDVMMPNMSGTEMCVKLKRNIQTCHIPVILLTARASVKYKIDGLETGADDYVTKPFNINLLKTRVRNIIQNRILIQQKFKQDPKADVKELTTNAIDIKVLEKAKEIVEQNIDNTDFDILQFAKEMGISRTRLYSKIKGVTGQTPNDFIHSTRLKKAAELLLNGDEALNISEVAYSVGFSTPRYFSKCFREHFGVSPSKYGKG